MLFKPKVTRLAQFYPSSFIICFSILFSIGIGIMKREKSKSEMLSFLDLTALGLGNSMGIGIFVLLGILTRTIAGPAVVLSIFISAITAALSGAKFYCTTKKKSSSVKLPVQFNCSLRYCRCVLRRIWNSIPQGRFCIFLLLLLPQGKCLVHLRLGSHSGIYSRF